MKQLVLCIDLGSSSVRSSLYSLPDHEKNDSVQVFDENLSASLAWEAVHPQTGKIRILQHQPERAGGVGENVTAQVSLFDLIDQCIDEVLGKLQRRFADKNNEMQIVAVGFSSLVMNLIGVDKDGKPVGEDATLSYACNLPQVAAKVKELQSQLGKDGLAELYQKTGAPMHAAYALPQLSVYYQQSPAACRVARWQTLASLCFARWLQQRDNNNNNKKDWPISFSEASWTGLLNTAECAYEEDILNLLPQACRDGLPALADFDALLSESLALRSGYTTRWPRLQHARFFLGIGDGACANVGSKCTTVDRIACTIGTSAAARVVLAATNHGVPKGLFCYRINQRYLLMGGALTDGGSVVAWIRELLNIQTNEEMQQIMADVDELLRQDYNHGGASTTRTQRPMVMLPFLSGERCTNFQTGATGALVGLTRATSRVHLVKACLEGVTLRLAAITRCLPNKEAQIWVSGKALEVNAVWRQIIADCTGRTVVLDPDTKEGSSRGVACLVAASLSGGLLACETASSVTETCPRPEGQAYWTELVQTQEAFIDAMRPIYAG